MKPIPLINTVKRATKHKLVPDQKASIVLLSTFG
jgi:hypothetical protein